MFDNLLAGSEGLGSVATFASCEELAGACEVRFQDCRPAAAELCLFLERNPRGRYVIKHSCGMPRRRHCVHGAVPLHFFLLSLQTEQAVEAQLRISQKWVRHLTYVT